MITETEGIILRQTKISGGRRMISIFTQKYGKISAGTNLNEKSRGKQALALRPFTHGMYEFFKKGDYYNINGADTLHSYYRLGEDVDKYMNASYALEFTDRITAEGQPAPALFSLAVDLMRELEQRNGRYQTLIAAYEVKALKILGVFPELRRCAVCGQEKEPAALSVTEGGILCAEHAAGAAPAYSKTGTDTLIYQVDFGIVDILDYLCSHPLESLRKLALDDEKAEYIRKMMMDYARYHLDFGELKSESFMTLQSKGGKD